MKTIEINSTSPNKTLQIANKLASFLNNKDIVILIYLK